MTLTIPPATEGEAARLEALAAYEILDTPPDAAFDDLVRVTAHVCGVPVALISLMGEDRQWFKAGYGLTLYELPRSHSFCQHALAQSSPLVIPDTTLDSRTADNPLVTGKPLVRFYAGAPLVTPQGHILGTLCVVDVVPRRLTPEQISALTALSGQVIAQMELRRHGDELARKNAALERESAERARAEAQFRSLFENSVEGIFQTTAEGRYLAANPALARIYGYTSPEELMAGIADIGAHLYVLPGQRQEFVERLQAQDTVTNFEAQVRRRDGDVIWIRENARAVRDTQGGLLHYEGTVEDITERKTAEAALRESERQTRTLADNVPVFIARVDTQRRYLFANRYYSDLLGIPLDQVVGHTLPEVLGEAVYAAIRPYVDQVLTGKAVEYEVLVPFQTVGTRFIHCSYVPEFNSYGEVIGFVLSSVDITERHILETEREALLAETKRLLAVALERADHDPLTGLLNHRSFHKRLQEEAKKAQQEGSLLAIAMLDLDNFKFFNDAYGHLIGDDVLRQVAEALRQTSGPCHTLARFGGDEFVLLAPGAGPDEIAAVMDRVTARLNTLGFCPPDHAVAVPLSATAGVAVFPIEAPTPLEALELADARLRLTKSGAGEEVFAAQRLRRHLLDSVEGFTMLDALVTAVDNKDRYTRRHSEDVLFYSLQIAQELGLEAQTLNTIAVAALLHDVGKIGVPDHILRKPGRLTDAEFQAVRQHPQIGAIIVQAVPGLEETLDAVRHHHERWDGQGYPFGLAGEKTPLIARLMAVADAYSAMTTDRPYRKGMDPEQALDILRRGAGMQWDPACITAFLAARARP